MSLFGKLIKDVVGDGIKNALGKAVEKAVAPAAEAFAEKTAEKLNQAADAVENTEVPENGSLQSAVEKLEAAAARLEEAAPSLVWQTALSQFPEWKLCPIEDTTTDEWEDCVVIGIYMKATEAMIDEYYKILDEAGFEGDWQIRRKTIDGRLYEIDFSFLDTSDMSEIRYCINK